GQATGRLAASVVDGGTVCNYGAMTEEEVTVAYSDLIFRGVSVIGFMLGRALARLSLVEVRALYADIAGQVCTDGLRASVEAIYPIEEWGAPWARPKRPARGEKFLAPPKGVFCPPFPDGTGRAPFS